MFGSRSNSMMANNKIFQASNTIASPYPLGYDNPKGGKIHVGVKGHKK
jgi:hypothetical protein